MENKFTKNDISEIYLKPKKNPQIRIGASYQAALPNSENVGVHYSENSPSIHTRNSSGNTNKERNFKYNENYIRTNGSYQKNENQLIKPGKKRRIEK